VSRTGIITSYLISRLVLEVEPIDRNRERRLLPQFRRPFRIGSVEKGLFRPGPLSKEQPAYEKYHRYRYRNAVPRLGEFNSSLDPDQ